jgi:hypothetical protein
MIQNHDHKNVTHNFIAIDGRIRQRCCLFTNRRRAQRLSKEQLRRKHAPLQDIAADYPDLETIGFAMINLIVRSMSTHASLQKLSDA